MTDKPSPFHLCTTCPGIIFIISMAVVCYMLVLVTAELDHNTRMGILFATIIVFAFRAAPTVGDGYFWWTLDELNFDAAFYGTLRQIGAILSIAVMWMFSRQLTESPITKTLRWIAVAGTRDLVRADGLADEHRGGGVTVADEVSQ
jgi:hypothetical protein